MSPPVECIVLGGGGHAVVVIDALLASKTPYRLGLTVATLDRTEHSILGVPILGTDEDLPQLIREGLRYFVVGLGGMRDTQPRQKLFDHGVGLGLTPVTIVHPSAVVSPFATLGAGAQVLAGAIINPRAIIGRNAIINTGSIVEHDCSVGDHAHVSVGSKLTGRVVVGQGAHIGAGAVVRQSLSIGAHAIVGAGAVVVGDVAANTIVVGVPAKTR
jgi:sugar O-acyltransferase (sialic acid O-acetyltransferase NeuD family)